MALPLAMCGSAQAGLMLDPDGSAGPDAPVTVGSFDFLQGNALLQGIGSLSENKSGQAITVLSHARLGSVLDEDNADQLLPGLNSSYEITVVLGFGATANVTGANTNFTKSASGPAFFRIYFDTQVNASDLAGGSGFNDGDLILSGTITAGDGSLFRYGTDTRMDRFFSDNYSGIGTDKVTGSTVVEVSIDFADPDFFDSLPGGSMSYYNSANIAAFRQVDPSGKFILSDGSEYTPDRGSYNGLGRDFQGQADANASFEAVPEPTSGLLALGACAILALRRRKHSA